MKKVLFVHDNRIYKDENGNVYTGSCYNNIIWNRYLQYFDELTICLKMSSQIISNDDVKKYNQLAGEKIHIVELPDVVRGKNGIINELKRESDIIEEAVKNADYLIARLPSATLEGNIAVHFAKKYNKPYLIEVVSCVYDSLWNYSIKGKFLAWPMYLIAKKSIINSPITVYVTEKYLQHRYPCKGESYSLSDVEIKCLENNNRHKSNSDKIVLGSAGAIDVKYKGHDTVIKAIAELQKQGIDVFEYQLAGDGDPRRLAYIAQQNKVADKIKFLGNIPHDRMYDWLDGIDIYIQPSKNEGLPRALIEAMSRGVPCFGTNTGGIPELLEKEFLFDKGNKGYLELAEKLKKIDNLDKIGKENVRKVSIYYEEQLAVKRNFIYGRFANELLGK